MFDGGAAPSRGSAAVALCGGERIRGPHFSRTALLQYSGPSFKRGGAKLRLATHQPHVHGWFG
ncbi:hypothetical protein J2Y41_001157 [Arthrobacter sp. 1088]|nr:hypothetical protein [Arthrobacter sp. 1088]